MFRKATLIILTVILAALPFAATHAQGSGSLDMYLHMYECTPGASLQTIIMYTTGQGSYVIDWAITNQRTGETSSKKMTLSSPGTFFEVGVKIGTIPASTSAGDTISVSGTMKYSSGTVIASAGYSYQCTGGSVASNGSDYATRLANVPGCDARIQIPNNAVMGTFTRATDTYYAPGALTHPVVNIPAGKTAWVISNDGDYYHILWGCTFLMVPVDSMGPNYDALWNGKPLPAAN